MKRHYIINTVLGLISFILVFWFINTEMLKTLELKFIDYRFLWSPAHKVNPIIIITAIDDTSIDTLGRWPWHRKIHAGLLKVLSQYPPKVIGFDVLFTEPEKEPREGDKALEYYTKLLGDVVYAGYISDASGKKVMPIQELANTGTIGFINTPPDKDGVIRKVPLVIKYGKDILPSFALQVLCAYLNIDFKDIKVVFDKYIYVPKIGRIPIDENGFIWINYVGDQHVFKEVAFQQVLTWGNDTEMLSKFSNKLLLVGITATGIGDQGNIPIANGVPLVAVHTNAINTILNKDFISKIPFWVNAIIVVIGILLSISINVFFKTTRAVLLSLLALLLFASINLWLFQRNIWIDILGPSLGLIVPFLLITVYKYGWEERQKRLIKKVFSHYLSGDVINILLKNPDKLQLGGELKTATVLYLDLRNFSGYCEGHSPEEVVDFLNKSFDWITEIILRHGGTLDKYVGDAIISIFGAPLEKPQKDQAEQAALTALEIVCRWKELPPDIRCNLDIGIGINTGHMLIGNMGSRYIFNYTAIGDEVNITARIQGLTGEYNTNIIITDSVCNLIKDKFKTEPIGEVTVKGRKGAVRIYKLSE